MPAPKQKRVRELCARLGMPEPAGGAKPAVPLAAGPAEAEAYHLQLDELVAAECPLTGAIMVESVAAPLLSPAELDAERAAWEI